MTLQTLLYQIFLMFTKAMQCTDGSGSVSLSGRIKDMKEQFFSSSRPNFTLHVNRNWERRGCDRQFHSTLGLGKSWSAALCWLQIYQTLKQLLNKCVCVWDTVEIALKFNFFAIVASSSFILTNYLAAILRSNEERSTVISIRGTETSISTFSSWSSSTKSSCSRLSKTRHFFTCCAEILSSKMYTDRLYNISSRRPASK